jgi:hypothetical protein
MIPDIREKYNSDFSQQKYQAFIDGVTAAHNHTPPFRLGETPVFIPRLLRDRLQEACEEINLTLCHPSFKEWSQNALKDIDAEVPGEDYNTRFLQMDFGICVDENGDPFPQLIELQGFPSLYFFQTLLAQEYKKNFDIPETYTSHFNGMNQDEYIELLRSIIVGESNPKNVVLLEIEPEKQATYIDFLGVEHYLGIKILCISKMKKRDHDLYYLDEDGKEVPIHKIYNRVIFDELVQRKDLPREFNFNDKVNVEWVGHPHWFFRISKFIMPLLKGKYIPESFYLDQLDAYPTDLENYVLKPLYSFSGAGVTLSPTIADLDAIENKANFILQKKVKYQPLIKSPNEPVKCEIRMLMLWKEKDSEIQIVNNLVRLTKGEMVGVKYNKDKDWVGASIGFFVPD